MSTTTKSENHIMIDFETLDTSNMPALLSIGATIFNPYTQKGMDEFIDFERLIDLQSCIDIGGMISASTIKWWMMQSNEARMKIAKPDTKPIAAFDVFTALGNFMKDNKVKKVWGHGSTFDCIIAENYFNKLGIKVPWQYWNTRDTRTIFDLTGITRTPVTVKHNALEDARGQAIDVIRCYAGFKNLIEQATANKENANNE